MEYTITYGRSVVTIAEQLFGKNEEMTQEEKVAGAQKIYDAVLNAFPQLRSFMISAQKMASEKGYVETILGRRRHIPDMMLPEFEFVPMKGYVNPDIDPLDINTLQDKNAIPERIVNQLRQEFKGYKYFGQIVKRIRELSEDGIKVINNRPKITEASRQCVNSVVQGSAADMTKMAILALDRNDEWKRIGGRLLTPVHDELIAEVPMDDWERGGEILSEMMCQAGDFLPFPIKCDVETMLRWYGMEFPCPYPMPDGKSIHDISSFSQDEIKWVQYHLVEMEYILPTYKDEDGNKPIGDAAHGVNGVISEEMNRCIYDYINNYQISESDFIEHIHNKVYYGT